MQVANDLPITRREPTQHRVDDQPHCGHGQKDEKEQNVEQMSAGSCAVPVAAAFAMAVVNVLRSSFASILRIKGAG